MCCGGCFPDEGGIGHSQRALFYRPGRERQAAREQDNLAKRPAELRRRAARPWDEARDLHLVRAKVLGAAASTWLVSRLLLFVFSVDLRRAASGRRHAVAAWHPRATRSRTCRRLPTGAPSTSRLTAAHGTARPRRVGHRPVPHHAYRCLPLTDARCALRGRKCDHLRAGALEPVHQRDQEDREGDGLLSRRRDCHCDDTPLFYRY